LIHKVFSYAFFLKAFCLLTIKRCIKIAFLSDKFFISFLNFSPSKKNLLFGRRKIFLQKVLILKN